MNIRWPEAEVFIGIACLALVALIILGVISEESNWQKFSSDHNCRIIDTVKGGSKLSVGTAIGPDGKFVSGTFTTFEPDRTTYKCDDGATYTR